MIFGKPFTYSGGKWVSDKGGAGGKSSGRSMEAPKKIEPKGKEERSFKVQDMAEELESVMMFTPKELSTMSPKEIKSAHRDLSEDWKRRNSGDSEW